MKLGIVLVSLLGLAGCTGQAFTSETTADSSSAAPPAVAIAPTPDAPHVVLDDQAIYRGHTYGYDVMQTGYIAHHGDSLHVIAACDAGDTMKAVACKADGAYVTGSSEAPDSWTCDATALQDAVTVWTTVRCEGRAQP